MDVRLPGMVYAVAARPPVVGGRLRSMDASRALALPGVLQVSCTVLRHQDAPCVIHTHLVNNYDLPPGGVGEPPVPPVALALCGAI